MEGSAIARYTVFIIAQCSGLIALFLIIAVLSNCGSIDWSSTINVHAFCMFFGMVYLQGLAISAFRVLTFVDRLIVKMLHMAVNSGAMITSVVALIAVFERSRTFSLHGVIGLITFILFALQWFIGFFSFLYPKLDDEKRAAVMPYHRVGGAVIFSLAVVTAVLGISSFNSFSKVLCLLRDVSDQLIAAGVLTLLYGILSVILVQTKGFKRR
ncbi:transmembrane ascorbate-dependent reductase CYB561 [Halyomorpha halys]|uniref:transmembrane ascorbate-dependent reductase CYB561 n=1 Tax=Halyomorpha halys TaxID=286706 RepID=UPI0006D513AC|nr:cytochrome b561 [Halyomorpha halys]